MFGKKKKIEDKPHEHASVATKSWVWVTFDVEGIHHYPEAATNPELKEVDFLQWPHRHTFEYKVWIEVGHTNRDREFIIEKRWMQSLFTNGQMNADHKSCEMLADELYKKLRERYISAGENRDIRIEVSEDGENGCEMIYLHHK